MSNIRNKKAVSWHYITMSDVGNTICPNMSSWKKNKKNKRKQRKKEKKRKENLQGSEQNVVGVKEIAQG